MSSNRRVERLISAARYKAHNQRSGNNDGISDRAVLEWLNDGARYIMDVIARAGSDLYTKEDYIDLTAGTAGYSLPSRISFGGNIISVQYSYSGNWTNQTAIELNGPISEEERVFYPGKPQDWLFLNGQIVFSPIPDNSLANGVRVTYREEPSTLDIRRGVVHADTSYNSSNGVLTTLKMNMSTTPADTNSLILQEDWCCIVDKNGTFLMRNIGHVTALNTTTGEISFSSDFRGTSTETAPAGAFITSGWNATTHSPFDPQIDDYLIDYAALWMSEYDHDDLSFAKKEKKLKAREHQIYLRHASMGLTEGFIAVPR